MADQRDAGRRVGDGTEDRRVARAVVALEGDQRAEQEAVGDEGARAVDRIEYAETAARYEYLNLTNRGAGRGLTDKEIREICRAFGITRTVFGRR